MCDLIYKIITFTWNKYRKLDSNQWSTEVLNLKIQNKIWLNLHLEIWKCLILRHVWRKFKRFTPKTDFKKIHIKNVFIIWISPTISQKNHIFLLQYTIRAMRDTLYNYFVIINITITSFKRNKKKKNFLKFIIIPF